MKILIIKLGADGDVLRTLPLAKALKSKYPDSEITWLTKGDISELLQGIQYISNVITIPPKTEENFDILYNFDLDVEASNLSKNIKADKKYGFYLDGGYPAAFNSGAEYYLNTMFDDGLKRNNKKTYQEMMFEAAELKYNKEDYEIILNNKDKKYADKFKKEFKLKDENVIGIHIGASSRWPSKVWVLEKVKEFIIKASKKGYKIILFGGPNEIERQDTLCYDLKSKGIDLLRNNPNNTKREFASLLNLCDVVVCSDSFALHLSLGLKKRTIGLFFCTSPNEVESYGLLKKVVSPLLYEFFPEKMNEFSPVLVNSITADEVLTAIEE